MCANYEPVTRQDRLLHWFGVHRPSGEIPPDLYPGNLAPFIVRAADRVELEREAQVGLFGLLPFRAKDLAYGRKTYNARSETAAEKPSFKDAWRRGRRCIVPAEAVYEPCYETGKAVRWRISRKDNAPMGIAGLWDVWTERSTGKRMLTFTMLTVNAERLVPWPRV